MTIEKDIKLFTTTVEKFYEKAKMCNIKGIVNDIRFLDSMINRISSNLSDIKSKEKTDFINSNSKYIGAEYLIDECVCTKSK